jgi:hypothetical protein
MTDSEHEAPLSLPSGSEQLKRTVEAHVIGRLEHLRVNLEFFIEDMSGVPSKTFPERFGGVLIDAENLLTDIKTVLNRSIVTQGEPPSVITDEMIEAAKDAMPWEGSIIPEEEQWQVMKDVLLRALGNNKSDSTILL